MVDIRNLSKDDYAKYALLVIYAWDMCNPHSPDGTVFCGAMGLIIV